MKKTKNILVLTQWSYKDPLIQTYTLPYVNMISKNLPEGSSIYLVTFEQKHLTISPDEMTGIVAVLRQNKIKLIPFQYASFGLISMIRLFFAFLKLYWIIIFRRINFIHAWCTPAGALGYVLSLFSGRPLIIDSYEPHAEAMVENQTWSKNGLKYKLLFYFEKKLSHRARTIISATSGMHEYAKIKYGINISDFFVKPACVDLNQFSLSKRKNPVLTRELRLDDKVVCVYAGKFGGIYLTKEVFDFFKQAEVAWGERFRVLLLTSQNETELNNWAAESNFSKEKMIIRFIPHAEIPDYLGLGDFGITPVKPIPTKKYCTPIKDGEYWALGLPVVITRNISDDSEIIRANNAGAIIQDFSSAGYNSAIVQIKKLLEEPKDSLSLRIRKLAEQYRNFQIAENIYKTIYGND